MKELLSSEEIDTLLDLFKPDADPSGTAATDDAGAGFGDRSVHRVDLLKPNRFSREQMRTLERMFESAGKGLAATFGDRLRIDVKCESVTVEQMRFQPWLKLVATEHAIYVLDLQPFSQPVPLAVSIAMLYGAVDRILGGSGRVQRVRPEFTAAEYTVADAVIGPCLDRLCSGLSELAPLSWSIEGRFCNASMAQVLPAQDVILSVHISLNADFLSGDVRLALPFAALMPHLETMDSGRGTVQRMQPGAMRDVNAQTMRKVEVGLSVLLGATEVPLRHLLQMSVGDVLPLPTRIGDPLLAPVQGKPKFTGRIGTRGSRLAFQVASTVES